MTQMTQIWWPWDASGNRIALPPKRWTESDALEIAAAPYTGDDLSKKRSDNEEIRQHMWVKYGRLIDHDDQEKAQNLIDYFQSNHNNNWHMEVGILQDGEDAVFCGECPFAFKYNDFLKAADELSWSEIQDSNGVGWRYPVDTDDSKSPFDVIACRALDNVAVIALNNILEGRGDFPKGTHVFSNGDWCFGANLREYVVR